MSAIRHKKRMAMLRRRRRLMAALAASVTANVTHLGVDVTNGGVVVTHTS